MDKPLAIFMNCSEDLISYRRHEIRLQKIYYRFGAFYLGSVGVTNLLIYLFTFEDVDNGTIDVM
jgi:hypothetical protein